MNDFDTPIPDELSKAAVEFVMTQKSMTPGDLAQALDVSVSFISLVRNCKRNLRLEHLHLMAKLCGLQTEIFIVRSGMRDIDSLPHHLQPDHQKLSAQLEEGNKFLVDFEKARRKRKDLL